MLKKTYRLHLRDVFEKQPNITIIVATEPNGSVSICLPGHEVKESGDMDCILIENRNGKPVVVAWADKTCSDPTHTITFEKAET